LFADFVFSSRIRCCHAVACRATFRCADGFAFRRALFRQRAIAAAACSLRRAFAFLRLLIYYFIFDAAGSFRFAYIIFFRAFTIFFASPLMIAADIFACRQLCQMPPLRHFRRAAADIT